jgi:hypothetical protein
VKYVLGAFARRGSTHVQVPQCGFAFVLQPALPFAFIRHAVWLRATSPVITVDNYTTLLFETQEQEWE